MNQNIIKIHPTIIANGTIPLLVNVFIFSVYIIRIIQGIPLYNYPFLYILLAIPLLWFLKRLVANLLTTYIFDTDKIIIQTGLITQEIQKIKLSDISYVYIKDTFFGRIFGYSTAYLGVSATSNLEILIKNVMNLKHILKAKLII